MEHTFLTAGQTVMFLLTVIGSLTLIGTVIAHCFMFNSVREELNSLHRNLSEAYARIREIEKAGVK